MNRELPQPGERWRHFKGNEYVIVANERLLTHPIWKTAARAPIRDLLQDGA